ncbi:glutamyl-tRNA reductase [Sulfidibacter corallicola]|uniref:Glutamyl-tRNA reductase n=1 Tax=Sulfidibacter corallicola TaxID=2818388 RepID=A0A8A4TYB4_SULCO|nr:glutamyl-tRNA reductase [Sulfidibacter corallicola]QTD54074.1 glutamyl-tRNA reductase [Sulfidibacter corallicola]
MTYSLHIIGTNFKKAPLEQVARVQWPDREFISAFLKHARAVLGLDEIFFLQTCNRREFYIYAPAVHGADREFCSLFLNEVGRSMGRHLDPADFYHFRDDEAVHHLFRVASSLDSMVLGETEIIKQLKDQSTAGMNHGHVGKRLNALINIAQRVSKQVRHRTDITKNVVSMASLALRNVTRHVERRSHKRVVFVGAGHFITSILPTFCKATSLELIFVNRTLPTKLAETYGGTAMTLEAFLEQPVPFEAMVTATGASHALFTAEWFERHNPEALILDAALPRDVDASVGEMEHIQYLDLAEMEDILAVNRAAREAEIPKAQPLFEEGLQKLEQRWLEFELATYNQAISKHYRDTGEKALSHLMKEQLADLSDEQAEAIRDWTESLVGKLTNIPILGLKGVAREIGPEAIEAYTRQVGANSNLFKSQAS